MKDAGRYRLKLLAFQGPLSLADQVTNVRHLRGEPRILINRSSVKRAHVFHDFLVWLRDTLPQLARHLEFRRLPRSVSDWSRYALYVPWLGDLLDLWSPWSYQRAVMLEAACRQAGVPIVNSLQHLDCSSKSLGAQVMRRVGIRTPRHVMIDDPVDLSETNLGLEFPFIIREDRGHGLPSVVVNDAAQLAAVDLSAFACPVAVEFIDTRSRRDGLFRKYRYLAAGDVGVSRHLMINRDWEVRPKHRVLNPDTRAEEAAYIKAHDPNHEILQAARLALGLDVVGFDYSYDRMGRVVVWEANAFPDLNYPRRGRADHLAVAVQRTFAAVARLYCVRAGLPVPDAVGSLVGPLETHSLARRAA